MSRRTSHARAGWGWTVPANTGLRASRRDGTGGNGVLGKRDGSGVHKLSRRTLYADNDNVRTLQDWTGATSGELNTGHLILLPEDAEKLYIVNGGQGATPTQVATAMNATLKAAMVAGDIPWGAIVYVNKVDPDDDEESWGVNAADGSFDNEDMVVYDIPAHIEAITGIDCSAANICCMGFSEGGFITLRYRAKFDADFAACYVVFGAPRLDADFPTPAATYTSFSAEEKAKLWDDDTAILQAQSPIASTAETALFNVYGPGIAPLLLIESDDGAGVDGDTTTRNSMNNAATELTALGVPYEMTNVYELDSAGNPGHVLSEYMLAWVAVVEEDSEGDVMDPSWIGAKFNG